MGDGRLGGISSTIAAQECLLLRGYDLAAVVLMDAGLANWKYLREHFGKRGPVVNLPPCRPPPHTGWGSSKRLIYWSIASDMVSRAGLWNGKLACN